MASFGTLTVYSFLYPATGREARDVSTFKATRRAILETYRGQVIEGTAEKVSADELDEAGRFTRLPTGWLRLT